MQMDDQANVAVDAQLTRNSGLLSTSMRCSCRPWPVMVGLQIEDRSLHGLLLVACEAAKGGGESFSDVEVHGPTPADLPPSCGLRRLLRLSVD